jgi:hypothetical protein
LGQNTGDGFNTGVGNGGSGVVIVRYSNTFRDLNVDPGLVYTKTETGGFKVFRFTSGTGTVRV